MRLRAKQRSLSRPHLGDEGAAQHRHGSMINSRAGAKPRMLTAEDPGLEGNVDARSTGAAREIILYGSRRAGGAGQCSRCTTG